MSKFLYPIYKLKTKSYIKWWLYHKKAGGSGILSEILEGFSFNLENTLNRKFKLFEIEGNSVQDGTPSPDNEVPILSAGDNGSITEKIVNKNIVNWAKNLQTSFGGLTSVINADGSITTTGKPNYNYVSIIGLNITNLLENGKTYTLSQKINQETKLYLQINAKNNTTGAMSYVSLRGATSRTFTADTENISYILNLQTGTTAEWGESELSITNYYQLEQGSTVTDFVPHEEQDYSIFVQQPMRSIGDVRDCFVKVNGNWYERHYIGRYIFTGNEYFSTLSQGIYRFNAKANNVDTKVYDNNIIANALSNYFIIETATHIASGSSYDGHFAISSTGTFDFNVQKFASATELKNWLAEQYANGTPVYVDYLLAEPLDLPCTEIQIQQLENKPSTYKDFTIIQSQDETPAHLKIQYYKEG